MTINFKSNYGYEEKKCSPLAVGATVGAIATAGTVAGLTLKKANQGEKYLSKDTFTNAAKDYAETSKTWTEKLLKKIKKENWAESVSKASNKKAGLITAGAELLITALLSAGICKLVSKN